LDTVLVDFGGGGQTYERVTSRDEDGKAKTKPVKDTASTEVLLLSPDGDKLLALEGAEDAGDKEREARLKQVHERLKKVKDGDAGKPGGPGNPAGGRNPFGKIS
jgi:hypothetical protein